MRWLGGEVPLVPGAVLPAEVGGVGWSGRSEAGFDQHPPRGWVVRGGGGFEFREPVPRCRDAAQVAHGRGRDAMTGDMLRNPVAQLRYAVRDEHEVEPTEDSPVLGDEHVVGALASVLLRQPGVVPLGELLEELITAIGHRSGEIGAVRELELQDCWSVVGSQTL